MIYSIIQFCLTAFLVVVGTHALNLSHEDLPVLALIIPALWVIPDQNRTGLILLGAMTVYGMTLSIQPLALSIAVLVLFPLLMVVFSKRSSLGVLITSALIVVTLKIGIMVTQHAGRLDGSVWATCIQILAVMVMWWAATHWQPTNQRRWWSLFLLLPLWLAGLHHAVLLSLSLIGILATAETLMKTKQSKHWGKLLCWTLPTIGFATLIVMPNIQVPSPVFVVWICLLGTAWMTDYILRSGDEPGEL
ncbi:hypothetical protein [Vibrio sagamiensis]|uniref:Integral membrane protein n=1 Tax=Vibrio sagamiensis NBRC 104589 TaxID=1219064 RepID=A0A511QCD1_9VIBR|nr:hypothetical protein [Vibrio sagamiensis]PNQ54512.1 hypothetical protein C1141_15475 [Vibrio agarivorans]GEM74847.1 hypothetical protein VSA01S_09590 [Vibrio sagamiensis NBRC 104589]